MMQIMETVARLGRAKYPRTTRAVKTKLPNLF
jgi:hypothetical protein